MEYTIIELEKLPLFNLRQIGREKGVRAPTKLTKAQLIQAITDIETGKAKPYIQPRKSGRPALATENVICKQKIIIEEKVLGITELDKLNRIKELVAKWEKEIIKIILE